MYIIKKATAGVNIFISSICYDLSQVKQDLCDYISDLEHNPMMSEPIVFPIIPLEGKETLLYG